MRKELRIILITAILLVALIGGRSYAVDQKVYDEADLFSEAQEEALQIKAAELSEKLSLDTVILTIADNKGKTSRDYADDFYDENDFGYGDSYDGLILLINMADREVYISTCGKAIEYFTDVRINSILDKVYICLTEENYSEGAEAFLNEVEYYVQKGIPSNQYSYDENTGNSTKENTGAYPNDSMDISTSKQSDLANRLLIYLLISFGIGGISVGVMAINNKGRTTTNQSTYLDKNSFRLINSQDFHVNTRVTFVRIDNDSNSKSSRRSTTHSSGSGRSTTHSSSSGRSHGGGGRKF
ncbi:TPM domain-containing protein [Proteiniborus sp. MB09-C3]|uniref:TPM domain-containing protein n=1 Tax=Proteiniborus sp. MB09-C3 TaxID=3050072 RepID=UPI0025541018|nr:TPM domain-containing protein [Proteiniborus sp. MB09-C3]WIV12425.1 TPM domain-containing protein [Proteiniborus sp. MB09-C3]